MDIEDYGEKGCSCLQRCALGAVVDGCRSNRASARECANGTFFSKPVAQGKQRFMEKSAEDFYG